VGSFGAVNSKLKYMSGLSRPAMVMKIIIENNIHYQHILASLNFHWETGC
jgi:hypothetical protein